MLFIPTLSKRQFESFVCARYGSGIDVLPPDGAVAVGARYFGLRYVGLQDVNGDLSAAMLLFEYKPSGFPPFFYGCKAHIFEGGAEAIKREFVKGLKAFAHECKAMYIFQTPNTDAVIGPIVVRYFWWFLYEKLMPLFRRITSSIKRRSKEDNPYAAISFSVFDKPI